MTADERLTHTHIGNTFKTLFTSDINHHFCCQISKHMHSNKEGFHFSDPCWITGYVDVAEQCCTQLQIGVLVIPNRGSARDSCPRFIKFSSTRQKDRTNWGGGLHFNKSLYSTGPSSKYEAHRNPNHLRITGLMAFSAPVACKILNIRCVFKKKKD